jgi:hypothetical protein
VDRPVSPLLWSTHIQTQGFPLSLDPPCACLKKNVIDHNAEILAGCNICFFQVLVAFIRYLRWYLHELQLTCVACSAGDVDGAGDGAC